MPAEVGTASGKKCYKCGRDLLVGESAWATEWKVIDTKASRVQYKIETRFTCDDCED